MKRIITLIFGTIALVLLSIVKINGQVAIGHVYAEVIESVNAISSPDSKFEFNSDINNGSQPLDQTNSDSNIFKLGSFTINSGIDLSYNVVVEQVSLSDLTGSNYPLQTDVARPPLEMEVLSNGSQAIQINGKVNFSDIPVPGLYHAFYTVVFAFD